uniref:Uncharacterized protein n=1 Tax=Sparus aurata TaxID=8175 RepID=A0A671VF09_SPAAU
MVPGAIVDLCLCGLDLDGAGAHVQQQVQPSIQQLHCKEVHLVVLLALRVPPVLRFTVGEEYQPVGLRRSEVKGDGAHALGVPLRQGQGTDISSIESKPALLQEYLDFLANALNEMIKSSLFEEEISFRTVRVVISF